MRRHFAVNVSIKEKEARFFLKLKEAMEKSRTISRSCLA
jgi:hypothetical protein